VKPRDKSNRETRAGRTPPWAAARPLVIAHRGASADAPENTLSAFRLARRLGAGMVELDVHRTKDRRLVVIHDPSLTRTTGVRAAVASRTLAEMADLDAGSWFSPRFARARVPTLEAVLAALGPRMAVNIEIKSGRRPYPGLEARLVALLRRLGWVRRALISSFRLAPLARVRRLHPTIAIGILVHPWSPDLALRRARRLGAVSVHPPARAVTAALIDRLHAAGLLVLPYTVDRRADQARLLRLGVDGFFTNRPSPSAPVGPRL
jgi:glycerophosphoryl diester phosphodiesterase